MSTALSLPAISGASLKEITHLRKRRRDRRGKATYPWPEAAQKIKHKVPWDCRHQVVPPNDSNTCGTYRNFFDRPTIQWNGTVLSTKQTKKVRKQFLHQMSSQSFQNKDLIEASREELLAAALPTSALPPVHPLTLPLPQQIPRKLVGGSMARAGCFRSVQVCTAIGK